MPERKSPGICAGVAHFTSLSQLRSVTHIWGFSPLVILAAAAFSTCAAMAGDHPVSIELNKIEPKGQACRVYFVVNNKSSADFQDFNLDLVLFRPDGVVGRNFKINIAPLKPNKRTVKLFDLDNDGTGCDQIGSFLINDVLECKAATGPVDDCLGKLAVSSLTKVQLTK